MTTRVTFAGDSITNPSNSWSWTRFLTDQYMILTGGTGISGATSGEVLNAVQPTPDADVLVVLLGTNDIRLNISRQTTRANIKAIVDKVGAKHTVLAMVPPCNLTADQQTSNSPVINRAAVGFSLNREHTAFAKENGWLLVDPWAPVRRMDGTYNGGTANSDGVHPSVETGTAAGDILTNAIRIAAYGTTS